MAGRAAEPGARVRALAPDTPELVHNYGSLSLHELRAREFRRLAGEAGWRAGGLGDLESMQCWEPTWRALYPGKQQCHFACGTFWEER